MLLSCEIGLFLGPYNSESPHFWAVKLYVAIDTGQTISLV